MAVKVVHLYDGDGQLVRREVVGTLDELTAVVGGWPEGWKFSLSASLPLDDGS